MAQSPKGAGGQPPTERNGIAHAAPSVNRKKQKRREKQAAKQAAERSQQLHAQDAAARNGHVPQGHSTLNHSKARHDASQPELDYGDGEFDSEDLEFDPNEHYSIDGDDPAYTSLHGSGLVDSNGYPVDSGGHTTADKKSKKKKRSRGAAPDASWEESVGGSNSVPSSHVPAPPPNPPTLSNDTLRTIKNSSKSSSIWNTSMAEERERIKEFWLSLNEKDRKGLVKIEKQTVLAKMKEQQKHSCSCTVCGRKRTAIEEELEVLYDAYYDELESYAERQQSLGPGMPMLPPPRKYGHPMGHMTTPDRAYHPSMSRKRLQDMGEEEAESAEDEYEDDEIYSGDESEEYSDEDAEEIPRGAAADFFNFGQSLTVKGGILTVADDLLQNDGKKFIEMMEQLAERRMQREEEAQFAASGLGHSQHGYTGHPPDEDDYDDEDEDEYDSQEDYEEEEDEMESMTEEQRMEEGRRMFQIFAARMFEQRVLTAYKEKVAKEKAEMLLQEQEEEERRAEERKAKKARDAQKKKAKKDLQKQAKAEEKAKKEAEKAQEEAATKAAEEKKQEELRKKKEEQRKKKEAERKAQEEGKLKKEAEKLKRQQEERERQQEAERKAREQKAQEKKVKEEARRKQREEQEAKEREAKERKAQEEKERREREAKAKAEKDAATAAAAAAAAAVSKPAPPQPPALQKRPSQQPAVGAPPGLRGSPQIAPALPKAPTPAGRPRQTSQPVSHGSSPGNSQAGPAAAGPPPGLSNTMNPASQLTSASTQPTVIPKAILTKQNSHASSGPQGGRTQPNSPIQLTGQDPIHGSPFGQPFPMSPFASSQPPGMPATNQRNPMGFSQQGLHQAFPPHPGSFQPFPPGGSMRGHPPGMGAPGIPPFGRGYPLETPPGLGQPMSGFPNQFPPPGSATAAPIAPPGHSRTSSASIDKSPLDGTSTFGPGQPTSRPNPIQRPSSTKPHPEPEHHPPRHFDESIDEMAQKMGSASLGGDEDEPFGLGNPEARGPGIAPGGPPNQNPGFGMSSLANAPGAHGFGSLNVLPNMGNNWHPPGFPPSNVTTPSWAASPNPANLWANGPGNNGPPAGFGTIGPNSAAFQNPRDRLRQLRVNVCRICRQLDHSPSSSTTASDGFHDLQDILHGLNTGIPLQTQVGRDEVVDILDTLGDPQNGGGNFETKQDGDRVLVKYESDMPPPSHSVGQVGGPLAGLGPIASPVQQPSSLAGRPFAPMGGPGF